MIIDDALAAFLVQLQADGRSDHTAAQYERHVGLLARWLDQTERSPDLADLGHRDLAAFMASDVAGRTADGRPKRASSMNVLRSSLRTFFRYLHEARILDHNPCRLLRRARVGPRAPKGLSPTEQRRLLATLEAAEGPLAERDGLLVRLMLATGIRLSAALGLTVGDVDPGSGEIVIWTKGHQEQVVRAPKRLARQVLRAAEGWGSRWLFPGRGGTPLGRRQAGKRFEGWVRRAGIRPVSPHALRHTYAARLYRQHRDLLLVQRALGHRSIQSTMVYAAGAV